MTDIRIPDLREPQRDADEQQIYDMALSMEVDLTPAALLAAATRRTGLDDLGDPTLVDRLAAQVAAVDADEGLSGLGRYLIRRRDPDGPARAGRPRDPRLDEAIVAATPRCGAAWTSASGRRSTGGRSAPVSTRAH